MKEEFDDEDECNYMFVVNRWFAKNEDDGQIVRELVPTDASGTRARSGSLSCKLLFLNSFMTPCTEEEGKREIDPNSRAMNFMVSGFLM